ncbi:MAG: creatininase family protein [Bacteroidales bacterium]|nr:creatininase family protein [Bacteroidales bacterium]
MRSYILAETNWKTLQNKEIELVVLPWGATEAHNYHLPYGTDNYETERIAAEAAKRAVEYGARLMVLPAIPFGVNTGQLDIRFDINMNPSTQFTILKDIAASLERHGVRKFLILNGHGGNDFRQMIRELGTLYSRMFISTCDWFRSVEISRYFEKEGGHADEMETSLMQYLVPELVLPLSEAGKGQAKKFRINAFNEKWAWAERKWSQVTADTGVGDPSAATPEKGAQYFEAVVIKISRLFIELSEADIDDMYV